MVHRLHVAHASGGVEVSVLHRTRHLLLNNTAMATPIGVSNIILIISAKLSVYFKYILIRSLHEIQAISKKALADIVFKSEMHKKNRYGFFL